MFFLGAGGDERDELADATRLLADIRHAFGDSKTMFTRDLLAKLNARDESPWGAARDGKGLDSRGLAGMLRPFGIKGRTVRVGLETAKGYHASQFGDAFSRYLSPPGSHRSQESHPSADGS